MPTTRYPLAIRMRPLTRRRNPLFAALALALTLCAALLTHALPARADSTVTVTTTTDEMTTGNGTCSLREAIAYANGTAETDCGPAPGGTTTIVLPSGHYLLSSATGFRTLSLTGNAVIQGAGAGTTIIDGGSAVQVLSVGSASQSTISGV